LFYIKNYYIIYIRKGMIKMLFGVSIVGIIAGVTGIVIIGIKYFK